MTEFLVSQETVKNCVGWTFSPLITVGSPVGNLANTSGNCDYVSRTGSKSQSYTSWDCVSRSYIGGAIVHDVKTRAKKDLRGSQTYRLPDTPTKEELALLTHLERMWITNKKRVFVRGKGVMTQKQWETYTSVSTAREETNAQLGNSKASVTDAAATEKTNQSVIYTDLASGSSAVVPPSPASPNLERQKRADPSGNDKYFYSDTIPIRVVSSESMTSPRETDPVPWSAVFQLLAARLNDPAATGVLAAVARSPNIRDATTWTSLVKAIMLRNSSRYEIAAMLRILCMIMSVSTEAYSTDGTFTRFIRGSYRSDFVGISIYPKPSDGHKPEALRLNIVAMPIDVFMTQANNSLFARFPTGYPYAELDTTWTVVPVSTDLIGQLALVPYIAAFITSNLWAGTVNVFYDAYYDTVDGKKRMRQTWLPAANNVLIDGVRNVAVVLIDETAQCVQPHFALAAGNVSVDVPIWRGSVNNIPEPVDWHPVWDAYWDPTRIDDIRKTAVQAHQVICTRMGVGDACGVAMSLAAEMYGLWYQGIAVPYEGDNPILDYDSPAYGCWTMEGEFLDKTKKIRSNKFNLNDERCRSARRRCIAYNFSSVSQWHIPATGLSKIKFLNDTEQMRITWADIAPTQTAETYKIQTMTSIYRLAAAVGLMITHTDSYAFGEVKGITHWVHMLSCAHSFSTAAFLSINDLSPREWAGMDNRYSSNYRNNLFRGLKTALYSGMIEHKDMREVYKSIPNWDIDIFSDYWGVDVFDSPDWMTFSPVPYHALWQWICKLGLEKSGITAPTTTENMFYNGEYYKCMSINRTDAQHKSNMVGTIDVYRRMPTIMAREPGQNYKPVLHWIDNVHRYSSIMLPRVKELLAPEMYESLTFCAPVESSGLQISQPTHWCVFGSAYEDKDVHWSGLSLTPIIWPDPPTLNELWTGTKNYILKPAASALAGFITGGPVGAAVAGGAKVVEQAMTDLTNTAPKGQGPAQKGQTPRLKEEAKPVGPLLPEGKTDLPNVRVVTDLDKEKNPIPVVMPVENEKTKDLKLTTTVKSTPTLAAETLVAKEPIKSLAILDGSSVNE